MRADTVVPAIVSHPVSPSRPHLRPPVYLDPCSLVGWHWNWL